MLSFIRKSQCADGSFPGESLNENSRTISPSESVFATSLTLIALAPLCKDPECRKIAKKAIAFLMREKNSDGSWNYWQRTSKQTTRTPIPDDLDDTSAALAAISLHAPELLDGAAWAKITQLLILAETAEGGPYKTWIVGRNAGPEWRDTDPGVNMNIGYFLSLHGIRLPKLVAYIEAELAKKNPATKYYNSFYTLAYFLSRFYRGPLEKSVVKRLFETRGKDGVWGTPQETALALTTLLRFDVTPAKLEKAATYLRKYEKRARWQAHPLYLEEKKPDPQYCGSPALTAAFALEALTEFEKKKREAQEKTVIEKREKECAAAREKALAIVRRIFATVSPEIAAKGEAFISKILTNDTRNEIVLLPYHTHKALTFRHPDTLRRCADLGAASLLGWIAYTIYDDILDDEGDPGQIPLANLSLRELTAIFLRILPPAHQSIFSKIMNGIEKANLWEREHCRKPGVLPDYGNLSVLAEKSLGHALAPVTLMLSSKRFNSESPEIPTLLSFFQHYLIARQMNDDAHDWQEDLARGFINSAAAKVLGNHMKKSGETLAQAMNLRNKEHEQNLQKIFWEEVVPSYTKTIFGHIRKARLALSRLQKQKVFRDTPYFEAMLAPLEKSTRKAREQAHMTRDFLREFS